jgi:hypothetical protein
MSDCFRNVAVHWCIEAYPRCCSAETNSFGTAFVAVVLTNPKLLGTTTPSDDALVSLKKGLGVEVKHLYVSFKGLEGFGPTLKK